MNKIKLIALTHKTVGLDNIGYFHIDDETFSSVLHNIKKRLNADELLYISTCNRVEFLFYANEDYTLSPEKVKALLLDINPQIPSGKIEKIASKILVAEGENAVRHLIEVASSIDSLVVGEREIITQVRKSYEKCKEAGLTKDYIRLAVKTAVETAKKIYTHTNISKKPVSVVSLAFKEFQKRNLPNDAKILVIGAGQTNYAFTNFLVKNGYTDITVFNRTLEKAQALASKWNGKAFPLSELANFSEGFDALITCTGASGPVITPEIYQQLTKNELSKKIIVDLAVPNDTAPEVLTRFNVDFVDISYIKQLADKNLEYRKQELARCKEFIEEGLKEYESLFKIRSVELEMQNVPRKIKEIKQKALQEVYANELRDLDPNSKEVLEKIISYMEKKYIAEPMKLAKQILLENIKKS